MPYKVTTEINVGNFIVNNYNIKYKQDTGYFALCFKHKSIAEEGN